MIKRDGVHLSEVAHERRPVRVCHLVYSFYPRDNRVCRYVAAASERGAEVDVIALRQSGQRWSEQSKGVRVFGIQTRKGGERTPFAYLSRLCLFLVKSTGLLSLLHLRRHYDFVHVHNLPDFLVFTAVAPMLVC